MRILAIVHERNGGPGVFAEAIAGGGHRLDQWFLPEEPSPPADPEGYDAVLSLGGSMNADQGDQYGWLAAEDRLLRRLIAAGKLLLGVCLGGQLLAAAAGATVGPAPRPEIGWHQVELMSEGRRDPVLGPLAPRFEAFQWHGYQFSLPPGAAAIAESDVCLQAARIGDRAWAVQFHPEVTLDDAFKWIAHAPSDPDAVRIGLDGAALAAETAAKIAAFNQLGHELCSRWLEQAVQRLSGAELRRRGESPRPSV
ncbi:MAG: type 1 glutamine amidotransferase [Actinobacteria bacterium]|nr:type 1 glutamine amidotransferase [Actinomycetota bacterium]